MPTPFKLVAEGTKYEAILPNNYQELTYRQLYRIRTEASLPEGDPDPFSLLEILSGISREVWSSVSISDIESKALPVIDFLSSPPDIDTKKTPKTIRIGDRDIKVPQKIGSETAGQVFFSRRIVKKYLEDKEAELKIYPELVACFLFRNYYGKNIDRALLEDLTELVYEAPAFEVLSLGAFFLRIRVGSL